MEKDDEDPALRPYTSGERGVLFFYFLARFLFMGVSQQMMSQASAQPHTASTVTARPQTSQA